MKRSPLLPIFLIVLVDVLGLTLMLPLLPFYAEHFGATPTQAGLLTSVYAACQLVSGPLLGRLSDRTGRKPLLLVSQLGTFLGFLLLGQATTLWMVFVSRIIDGSTAGNLSLAQAYIADVTAPKDRAKSFAIIGVAFGIGFLVGPGVSGLMAHAFGQRAPVYLAAALSFTSILCTAFLLPKNPPKPEGSVDGSKEAPVAPGGKRLALLDWGSYAKYFQDPALARLLIQFFLFTLAFACFTSTFALFAERTLTWHGKPFGQREVGFVFVYAGFLGSVLQGGLIGRLVKRFGEKKLITSAFLASCFGYLCLASIGFASEAAWGIFPALGVLILAGTVQSYGSGVLRPALTSLITQNIDRREQGTILGLTQSLLSVAQIVSPAIGGFLIARSFFGAWALWPASLALLGFVLSRTGASVKDANTVTPGPVAD
jgi:DHA1 family tetracycline resistance protein-like MFS transporter